MISVHNFRLGLISHYRIQLMGIATIMIIACHAVASHVIMPNWLGRVLIYGNLGVDFFLFLSGIGCFYSLCKYYSSRVGFYYKRRVMRIMPAYLIIFIPLNILYIVIGERNVEEFFLSIITMEFWCFHKGAWFVSLIIPLYLLSPVLYKLMCTRYKWVFTVGIIAIIVLLCGIPLSNNSSTNVWHNLQFAFSRSPSFVLGMAIANGCKDNKQISVIYLVLLLLFFIPLYVFCPNMFFGWLLIPLMLFLIIEFVVWLKHICWIDKSFRFMGNISLESYLLNISLNAFLTVLIIKNGLSSCTVFYGNWLQYSIVVVLGTFLAYATNRFCMRFRL